MRASDTMSRAGVVAAYALPGVTSVFVLCAAYPEVTGCDWLRDPMGYCQQIESGDVTTWWSPLYMFECRWVLGALRMAAGGLVPPQMAMMTLLGLSLGLLCVCSLLLLRHIRRRGGGIMGASVILCVAESACYAYIPMSYPSTPFLDAPASALLACAVILSLMVRRGASWWKTALLCGCITLLLFHACAYRTPYLLVAMVVVFRMVYCTARTWRFPKALAAFALFLSLMPLSGKLLPSHRHEYPLAPMLLSDIKIASVFAGEKGVIPRLAGDLGIERRTWRGGRYELLAADYGAFTVRSDDEWHRLLGEYVSWWCKHPGCMADARLLQIHQFLACDFNPAWFRQAVHAKYPHVPTDGCIMDEFIWLSIEEPSNAAAGAFLAWLAGCAIPAVSAFRRRKETGPMRERGICVYLAVVCFCSLACYLSLAVPTPDFRYRIQAMLIAAVSLAWWWGCFLLQPRNSTGQHGADDPATAQNDTRNLLLRRHIRQH